MGATTMNRATARHGIQRARASPAWCAERTLAGCIWTRFCERAAVLQATKGFVLGGLCRKTVPNPFLGSLTACIVAKREVSPNSSGNWRSTTSAGVTFSTCAARFRRTKTRPRLTRRWSCDTASSCRSGPAHGGSAWGWRRFSIFACATCSCCWPRTENIRFFSTKHP